MKGTARIVIRRKHPKRSTKVGRRFGRKQAQALRVLKKKF